MPSLRKELRETKTQRPHSSALGMTALSNFFHTMKSIPIIFALCSALSFAGVPERAKQQTRAYDLAYETWTNDVRTAPDDDAQNAAWLRQPDALLAGKAVWDEIRSDLSEAWTLEYASWMLTNTPEAAVATTGGRPSPAKLIRDAVEKHHLKSSKVGPYCIALTHIQDPRAMKLLEIIEKENPNAEVKGAAALGQAILHRRLGDEKHGMWHRQEKLKQAIQAPELVVGKTTTLEIIKDEIFRMNNLTVGTRAPDFQGVDITQKVSALSEYEGKVVILFFWHALMPAHDQSLALMKQYQEEFSGKNIAILGVNMDNPLTLRKHTADGAVTWRNFSDSTQKISKLYRIERWPYVYVLDQNQTIRHVGEPGAFVKITAADLLEQPPAKMAPVLEQE